MLINPFTLKYEIMHLKSCGLNNIEERLFIDM